MHPKSTPEQLRRVCIRCGATFTVDKPSRSQKYCSHACYIANQYGDTVDERFWSKVDRRGPDDCWEWQAGRHTLGYGAFRINGQQKRAHRFAWEITHGPIPDGLLVCHECDNPPCCNPSHLFLGTVSDNTQDAANKGRLYDASGSRNGHAKLSEENVRDIRRMLAIDGRSTHDVAVLFNVSTATVRGIMRGKRWAHLANDGLMMPTGYPSPQEGVCRKRLHQMTPENTVIRRRPDGTTKRLCKACRREADRRKRSKSTQRAR